LLLSIFIIALGISQAGLLSCPPACPDCANVSDCCAKMDTHQPERTGCSHGGICSDSNQPVDVGLDSEASQYESLFLRINLGFQDYVNPVNRTEVAVSLKPPLTMFPALYLRNCSFLI
jgi:hypothetical protein